MASNLKRFKARALARPGVKKAYDDLAEEFAFLDAVLKGEGAIGTITGGSRGPSWHYSVGDRSLGIGRDKTLAIDRDTSSICKRSRIQAGNTSGEEEHGAQQRDPRNESRRLRPPPV